MHWYKALFSADEHAQTSESPNMATATPSARRGPDAAEAARLLADHIEVPQRVLEEASGGRQQERHS